ncbi:phage BR0599 family protein [Gilliamella sp. BG7]|uniref:phage BR0599 family protein n=1 Tax=unclassified Gilliamella TaxID=2685620 RepID=UPI0039879F45
MRDLNIEKKIYIRESINRSAIKRDASLSKNKITITMPITNEVVQQWITPDITKYLLVDIYTLDKNNLITMSWSGRLTQTSTSDKEMDMTFEPLITRAGQTGVNERVQRNCRYALYSERCGLNRDDFKMVVNVTSYKNDVLTVVFEQDMPNGYFTGGILQTPNGEQTFIKDHSDTSVVLFRRNQQLVDNLRNGITQVTLYKGCSRTLDCCDTFNNTLNYGGFPYLPLEPLNSGNSIV